MANSTLEAIMLKVRRLTRSPSANRLTDDEIKEYVNTFILYDMPEHVKLFALKKTLTFYTLPYIDEYKTDTTIQTDPLYNFKNVYTTILQPIYIGGYTAAYFQDQTNFYNQFPLTNFQQQVGTGDGVTQTFSGTLNNLPLVQNNVTFSSLSNVGVGSLSTVEGPTMKDVPVVDSVTGKNLTLGNLYIPNQEPTPPSTTVNLNNFVDYVNGTFAVTFNVAPTAGQAVYANFVNSNPSRPNSILYYNDRFVIRPVPDKVYPVQITAYKRPLELLANNESPELEQWWQYIAYGASKKVFEDRADMKGVQDIMPEFEMQEALVLRRTLNQNAPKQAQTIYDEQTSMNAAWGNGFWNL